MIMFGYTVYTIDKFHIQWCLYPMMDLWNTINEWMNEQITCAWKNCTKEGTIYAHQF